MSYVQRHSLIKGHRLGATIQERAISWPLIVFTLAITLIILLAFIMRTRLLHRSVAEALIHHTKESRYASQSFRGILSTPMGSELLDATQAAGEVRDQKDREVSQALATATTLAIDLIKSTGHSPTSMRNLSTYLESTCDLAGVSKSISSKLNGFPQPISIPADSTLRKIRYTPGDVGVLQFDLLAKDGNRINGLTVSDLTVTDTDGNEWPHIAVEQILAPLADYSIAILVDKSSSMAGDRMAKLQAGLEVLIANCDATTRIQIIAFDSKVTQLTTYTNDHRVLVDAVRSLIADGATEITKGLDLAIDVLSPKPGHRSILLCTDGQDPKLASNLARIVTQCNSSQININVLGLEDASLDKAILAELAMQTEGHFCIADRPLSINDQINRLIESYSKPSYRLSVFNPRRTLDRFRVQLINVPGKSIDVEP